MKLFSWRNKKTEPAAVEAEGESPNSQETNQSGQGTNQSDQGPKQSGTEQADSAQLASDQLGKGAEQVHPEQLDPEQLEPDQLDSAPPAESKQLDPDQPGEADPRTVDSPALGDSLWSGPYSEGESGQSEFFDLRALRIPLIDGVQVAPVLDSEKVIQAVEIIAQDGQMQVAPFAMQRSGGLWEQVLADLREQLADQPYQLFPLPGPYGEALLARPLPDSPAAKAGAMPMLLWGIEGDRWMLRVIMRGAAAEEEAKRQPLVEILRRMEVVRGKTAMVPGDLLAMELPQEMLEQLVQLQAEIEQDPS